MQAYGFRILWRAAVYPGVMKKGRIGRVTTTRPYLTKPIDFVGYAKKLVKGNFGGRSIFSVSGSGEFVKGYSVSGSKFSVSGIALHKVLYRTSDICTA